MDVDPEMMKIIITAIITLVVGGGGGMGFRQYLLKRQNGNSTTKVLKGMVDTQGKTVGMLWKMDRKMDNDRKDRETEATLRTERDEMYRELEKERSEKLCKMVDRINDKL